MNKQENLADRIEEQLKKETKVSENPRIEASSQVPVTQDLVIELLKRGICTHWMRREFGYVQECHFDGTPNDCRPKFFQKNSNRWVFSTCPLKK